MTARLAAFLLFALVGPAAAQDPVQVDSTHYAVEFENDCVRVLRIHYGPGERSVQHSHPDGVAVLLTSGEMQFSLPDGSVEEAPFEGGNVVWAPGGAHLPENTGTTPIDVVLVELKPGRGEVCTAPPDAGGGGAGRP